MSFGLHIWQSLMFLALAVGPLPLCLALSREPGGGELRLAKRALALLTGWLGLQAALAIALGALGWFTLPAVLLGEGLLFLGGGAAWWSGRRRPAPPGVTHPPDTKPFRSAGKLRWPWDASGAPAPRRP